MKTLRIFLALSLLAILISGCGGGSHNNQLTQSVGRATFTVRWPLRKTKLIPEASSSILVTLTKNGATVGTKLLVRPVSPPFDTVANFDPLPTGDLQVLAKAYPNADGTGVAQATGSATLTVLANQNATLSLTMGTTITKVVVAPLSLTIPFGGTALNPPLTASAMDADGNLVLTSGNTWNWSSNNTNYVQITPTQATTLVRGVGIGETQVIATETESNISGQANVKVIGSGIAVVGDGKFRANQQNSGLSIYGSSVDVTNGRMELEWCFATGGQIDGSPVVAPDGTVYVGSSDSSIYAFEPDRGGIKWQVNLGGHLKSSPAIGSDGTVYVASVGGVVTALEPANGNIKWQLGYGGASFTSSPNIGSDGTLFLGSQDGNVFALDGSTGNIKWNFNTRGSVESSPALSQDKQTLFIGSSDKNLYALSVVDGSQKWSFATRGAIVASPVVALLRSAVSEVVYVGSSDGNFYAVKAEDGTQFWRSPFRTQGAITSSAAISYYDVGGTSTPVLVFGSTDTFVYALNAQTGQVAVDSPLQLQGGINSSPTIDAKGAIFIGSDDLSVYRLSLSQNSLTITGTYRTNGAVSSSAAIGTKGFVFIGSGDAKIYAFGPIL